MNKLSINMVGGGFQHNESTNPFGTPKHFLWDKKEHLSNISIHIDDAILWEPNQNKINYGWICESSAIIPNVIQAILSNLDHFKLRYKHIFTTDTRIIEKDPIFFKFTIPCAVPWIQNKKIYSKSKLVSMIASDKKMCEGHIFRQNVISKFRDKVDHFGRGFGNKELPWSFYQDGLLESGKIIALKDYMFSIAMENINYDFAFSEKVTDCFSTGTIPVFWGGKKIDNFFDINGIIFLEDLKSIEDLNEELYYSKLEYVKKNFNLACEFESSEDYIYLNYLKEEK